MRILQSTLFRALCAIAIGALLLAYPGETATWIIILIGVLFLCSGVLTCAVYMHSALRSTPGVRVTAADGKVIRTDKPSFPLVGTGSLILGLILTLMPATFGDILVYIIAVVLVFGAINQLVVLDKARRLGMVQWGYWICPSLILLAAIVAIFRPSWIINTPIIIVGVTMVVYGLTEVINLLKVRKVRKRLYNN